MRALPGGLRAVLRRHLRRAQLQDGGVAPRGVGRLGPSAGEPQPALLLRRLRETRPRLRPNSFDLSSRSGPGGAVARTEDGGSGGCSARNLRRAPGPRKLQTQGQGRHPRRRRRRRGRSRRVAPSGVDSADRVPRIGGLDPWCVTLVEPSYCRPRVLEGRQAPGSKPKAVPRATCKVQARGRDRDRRRRWRWRRSGSGWWPRGRGSGRGWSPGRAQRSPRSRGGDLDEWV
mmetsp:Transcript_51469/g.117112  ORF Transcript_51469/g.117112 Transcript_51469/m.117112 type:complete len:230 (+) Transcript_51469:302-991(+)